MDRRQFVAGTAAALAGCTAPANPPGGGKGTAPSGPRLTAATLATTGDAGRNDPPTVTWHADAGTVVVAGHVWYGSSSCRRVALRRAAYDAAADVLRVVVGPGEKPGAGPGCTADMASAPYRVTARFDGGLPGTVRVVEYDAWTDPTRRTVTRGPRESGTDE